MKILKTGCGALAVALTSALGMCVAPPVAHATGPDPLIQVHKYFNTELTVTINTNQFQTSNVHVVTIGTVGAVDSKTPITLEVAGECTLGPATNDPGYNFRATCSGLTNPNVSVFAGAGSDIIRTQDFGKKTVVDGNGGNDVLIGSGFGPEVMRGEGGSDVIDVRQPAAAGQGNVDTVNCGGSDGVKDTVFVKPGDTVNKCNALDQVVTGTGPGEGL